MQFCVDGTQNTCFELGTTLQMKSWGEKSLGGKKSWEKNVLGKNWKKSYKKISSKHLVGTKLYKYTEFEVSSLKKVLEKKVVYI